MNMMSPHIVIKIPFDLTYDKDFARMKHTFLLIRKSLNLQETWT